MTPIAFTIDITPVSGQFHDRTGRTSSGKPVRYKTRKGTAYRREVKLKAAAFRPESPLSEPLRVGLTFYRPRPKSRPAWVDRERWKSGGRLPYRCDRHDLDNMAKPFIDALIGDFWAGDGVITALDLERFYHEAGGAPRVEVQITEHKEAPCS